MHGPAPGQPSEALPHFHAQGCKNQEYDNSFVLLYSRSGIKLFGADDISAQIRQVKHLLHVLR